MFFVVDIYYFVAKKYYNKAKNKRTQSTICYSSLPFFIACANHDKNANFQFHLFFMKQIMIWKSNRAEFQLFLIKNGLGNLVGVGVGCHVEWKSIQQGIYMHTGSYQLKLNFCFFSFCISTVCLNNVNILICQHAKCDCRFITCLKRYSCNKLLQIV